MTAQDRRKYLTASTLDQDFLDQQHGALVNKLEMVAEIETPTGTIYVSDRDKYVGSQFYRARTRFPTIKRTVGDLLSPNLAFSNITLEIANSDGEYNNFLPEGGDFESWIGKSVVIKLGLAEVASTYKTIFSGLVTEAGGFGRSQKHIKIQARDRNDRINKTFPVNVFNRSDYPKISNDDIGKGVPIIYGDWTEVLEPLPALVPTTIVNKADKFMTPEEESELVITIGSPTTFFSSQHLLEVDDEIQILTDGSLPTGLSTGTKYFVVNIINDNEFELSTTQGGASINTSGTQSGTHTFQPFDITTFENVHIVISDNANQSLDQTKVFLLRGNTYYTVPSADIANVNGDNNYFEIVQDTANLWVEGGSFKFTDSDLFYVRVVGKDLGSYDSNIVWQTRDILKTYGTLVDADFHSNWATYRDKSTPAISAISSIKSRIWVQESNNVLEYSLSLLEQVRLEAFFDRDNKFKILSNHFEDWDDSPSFEHLNWDIVKDSFNPQINNRDEVNFNRTQAIYKFFPIRNENALASRIYKNQGAINQVGKEITKSLVYPNLYVDSDVANQLSETLKLTSGNLEFLSYVATWRSMLLDIGDFVLVNVTIGSLKYTNVPAMIREISYNPKGLSIPVRCLSLQMFPFESYNPGHDGIISGQNASITIE